MANSYAFIFVEKQIANPPERTMADACGYVDGQRQEKRGVVIFPNEPKPVRIDAGHGTTFPSDVHTIGYIWIAVCTAYGDDMGGIHHTKTWLLTQPVANSKPVPVDSNLSYFPIREAKIASEETDQ